MSTRDHRIQTPMSALIDVVFLLLIYFAVTYVVERDEQAQEFLQGGCSGRSSDASSFLTVLVTDEAYELPTAKRQMTLPEIQSYLGEQLRFDPDYGVSVRVAPDTEHGRVIALLDRCREVKCQRLRMLGVAR